MGADGGRPGQFAEFNIYHIIPVDDALSLFPIEYVDIKYPSKETQANGHAHTNGHAASNGHDTKVNGHAGATNGTKVDPYALVSREIAQWVSSEPPKPTFRELVQSGRKSATISELARICRSKNVRAYPGDMLTF